MPDVKQRIQETIDANKIVIYMKGSPSFPMCGFSATTIEIFNELSVPYETVDVLQDGEVREGIKVFSNWPTIPQVYVDGKFLGGCDIIREMHAAGELQPALADARQ
ncbi:MAG: Grx4 family monothiol glutaredoxin [bacterium]